MKFGKFGDEGGKQQERRVSGKPDIEKMNGVANVMVARGVASGTAVLAQPPARKHQCGAIGKMQMVTQRKMMPLVVSITVLVLVMSVASTTRAAVIGFPLVDRPYTEGALGLFMAMPVAKFAGLTSTNTVASWGFYNNDAEQNTRLITPFIMHYESGSGNYTLTGIGTTRTNAATGAQYNAFGLVSGSAEIGAGYTFGWLDGTFSGTRNNGVAEFSEAESVVLFSSFGEGVDVPVGTVFTPWFASFGRQYSAEVTTVVPEPSMVLLGAGLLGLLASARRKRC